MKEFRYSLKWIFIVLPFLSFAQLPQKSLSAEQPAELFYPLKITTVDSTFSGYGNINSITYNSLIFTSIKPTDKTKDWVLIKNFEKAQLVAKDTLTIIPLLNTVNKDKKQRIVMLTSLVYENKELSLYKYLHPFYEDAYLIIPKNMPYDNQHKKIIVIRTEKILKRFALRAFKKCKVLTRKINSNHYSNDFTDLIKLVDDYQDHCSEMEW